MNITAEKFNELKQKEDFTKWSSWAIWDDDFKVIPDFGREEKLHTNYVIIGLNPSERKDGGVRNNTPWANFHTGVPDKKLHDAFKDTKVWGAFMTDLFRIVKTTIDIDEYCRKEKPEIIKEYIQNFRDVLKVVDASEETTFILLGNSVQQYFNFFVPDNFCFNPIIKLRHYSDYRKNWVEEAKNKIKEHENGKTNA